jgi:malonyl-CoA/methylmalonyl-CoA synthetase
MKEKTEEAFKEDGFFITGDLAQKDESGYFTIVGRDKDMIISGGLNVYPKEIEDVLNELPNVLESAVFGLQHADFGEAVVAAVVVNDDKNDENQIIDFTKDKIAKYKQPKKIIFMDNLPRNSMGKVQKNLLRKNNQNLFKG